MCDACIVVGGIETTGYHSVVEEQGGKMASALVITQCNEGDLVYVRAKYDGTELRGNYRDNWTMGFSGVLLNYVG